MYSWEEKISITEAFLESGLTAAAAGRRPGWPSRFLLSKWVAEAKRGELPVRVAVPKGHVGKRKRHDSYSEKTKAEAVKLYEMGRRPVDIARLLGIDCSANIRTWWKKAMQGARLSGDPFKPKPLDGGKEVSTMPKRKEVPPEVAALSESELENACLRAVLADLKAEGWDLASISNRKKVELGERLRQETGRALREIIDFLKISKSSYEYHRKRLGCEDPLLSLRSRITGLFWENEGRYGYRRIWGALRAEGLHVSEKVVRRIMKEEGLLVFAKRRKYSSYKGDISPEVPNLVNRNFRANAPNVLWLTDISEFKIPAGKVYLSPMLDCFDGMLVSWSISTSPNAELVNTMLDDAIGTLREDEHPTVHSDQGCHYRWPGWIERMEAAGLTRSMSRKGCSPDNSACEGVFGRIKTEMFYYRSWKGVSIEEFIGILNRYLQWYNNLRIKKSLDYLSPLQFRQSLDLVA